MIKWNIIGLVFEDLNMINNKVRLFEKFILNLVDFVSNHETIDVNKIIFDHRHFLFI